MEGLNSQYKVETLYRNFRPQQNRWGHYHLLCPSLVLFGAMTVIQEAYVEDAWEGVAIARQRRDTRYAELQAAGMECHREDLYTVDLKQVFVVTATPMETVLSAILLPVASQVENHLP